MSDKTGCTVKLSSWPSRLTVIWIGLSWVRFKLSIMAARPAIGCPSTLTISSPSFIPAFSAGMPGSRSVIGKFGSFGSHPAEPIWFGP